MNYLEIAYLAGIMDGEGCILINRTKKNKTDGYLRPYKFALHVRVRTCDKILAPLCQELLGVGSLHTCKAYKPNHNTSLEWHTGSNNALRVLQVLLPYLRVKHKQAELAIKFQTEQKKHKYKGRPMPDNHFKFLSECYSRMKGYNKRGKVLVNSE